MVQFFRRERLKRACNRLLNSHQYTSALEKASEGQAFPQKDAHFQIYAVWALIENKQLTEALEKVETALTEFSHHQVLLNLKGEILFKLGDLDQALACLQQVYQEAPDNLHTAYIMGQVFVAKGDLDQSSKYFESILQYDPKILQVRLLSMAERYIYEMNQKR
ncbi:MAG: tetratricopeptide repeat protein [Bdellovibrionota bacterium]